jgi:hypothetical protein
LLRKLAWLWLSDWLSEGVDWAERLLRKLAWLWLSDWLSEGVDWAERLLRKLAWLWLSDWLSEGVDWAERLLRNLAWLTSLQLMDELGHILRSERYILCRYSSILFTLCHISIVSCISFFILCEYYPLSNSSSQVFDQSVG